MKYEPEAFQGAWRTGLTALAVIFASGSATWSNDQWTRVSGDPDSDAKPQDRTRAPLAGQLVRTTQPSLTVNVSDDEVWNSGTAAESAPSFIGSQDSSQSATANTSILPNDRVQPRVSFQVQAGTEDESGTVDMFIPVYQTPDSVAYFDLRGVATGDAAYEGNIGGGYRTTIGEVFGEEAVVGGFAFFDVRQSPNNNMFYQGTVGLEFLTDTFEARVMGYLPNANRHVLTPGSTTTVLNGTAVQQVTSGAVVEQALPGVEAEIGLNLDLTDTVTFRGTGGYYHFERDLITVAGPKARAEFQFADPFGFDGATLSIGGELRHDELRDTDASAFVRFSIPLGSDPAPHRTLSKRTKKLGRYVYRDRDILVPAVIDRRSESAVDVTGAAAPPNSAPGTPSAEGQSLDIYHVADTPQGAADCSSYVDACTVGVAQADPDYGPGDALIVVDSGGATINSDIFLNGDLQSVLGANGAGQVTLALNDEDNTVLTLDNLGSRVTVAGTVQPDRGSTLSQFDIDGGQAAALNIGTGLGPVPFTTDDIDITGGSTGLNIAGAAIGAMTFDADSSIAGTDTSVMMRSPNFELTFDGSITHSGTGAAIDVQDHISGNLTFNGAINATNGPGIQFNNADSTYAFNGMVGLDDTGNASGIGIDITNGSDGTFTFTDLDITNTAPATARPGAIASGSAATGIDIVDSPNGTFTFTDLDITSAADIGVAARNGGTVHIGDAADPSVINGGLGVLLFDTSATINNAQITGGTDDTDFDVAAPAGSVAGDFPSIGEGGVLIVTELQETTVSIQDTSITGAGGLADISSGDSDHELSLSRNTISSTDFEALFVENRLLNPGATGETFITGLDSNTITAAGSGGMIFVDTIFDADPTTATADAVTGGMTTIGTTANRVSDVGLVLDATTGALSFTSLDIANDDGLGLVLANDVAGLDPFALTISAGSIDTTNDGAVFIAAKNNGDVTLNVTLSSITSTGGDEGIGIFDASGTFDVTGTTSITGFAEDGIDLEDNDAVITFGTTSVNGTGSTENAIEVVDNLAAITFGATSIDGAGDDGIELSGNQSLVAFGATTIMGAVADDGIDIDNNPGAITFGDTLIQGVAADGIEIKNSAGDVTFGNLTITGVGDDGIQIEDSSGDITFSGNAKIDDLDDTAIEITGSTGQSINFNGATDIGGASRLLGDGLNITGTDSLTTITFADLDIRVGGTIGAPGDQSGIDVDGGQGLLTITTGRVDSSDGPALDIDGLAAATPMGLDVTLTNLISEGSNTAGIQLDNITGSLTIDAGRIERAQGTAFDVGGTANNSGGDATVVFNGTIENTGGRAVFIQELAGGSITLGGDITDTGDGIKLRRINNGTTASVSITGNTSLDGGALEFESLDDANVVISGNLTIDAADNAHGIEFDGDVGTIDISGQTSITAGNGASGILFDSTGSVDGNITISDLDIALTGTLTTPGNGANGIALNAAGADVDATFQAVDFDVTGNVSGQGTTGVDLSGTTGTGSIQLGDTDFTGASSTIGGQVAVGIQFSDTTNVTFTYGDGEDANDQGSTIDAAIQINAPAPPTAGDYNFNDVDFTSMGTRTVNNIFPSGSASDLIFVSAGGTNLDALNTTVNDPTSIALADAVTNTNAVFVLINDGNIIRHANQNGFSLSEGQSIDGFGNGNSFTSGQAIPMVFSGVPGGQVTVTDPFATGGPAGSGGAATLKTEVGGGAANFNVLLAGDNQIANVILDGLDSQVNIAALSPTAGSGNITLGSDDGALVVNDNVNGAGIVISNPVGTVHIVDVEVTGGERGFVVNADANTNIDVDRLIITNVTGEGLVLNSSGGANLNLADQAGDTLAINGAATGIDLNTFQNSTAVIGNATPTAGAGTSINFVSGTGFSQVGSTGATVTYNGDLTVISGTAVDIQLNTDLNTTFNGEVKATPATSTAIEYSQNTGTSSVTFNDKVTLETATSKAVNIHSNTGTNTVSFTGGLQITSSAQAEEAFVADGLSGHALTVNITGAGNSINASRDSAIRLQNLTSNVTFDTITAKASLLAPGGEEDNDGIRLRQLQDGSSFAVTGTTTIDGFGNGRATVGSTPIGTNAIEISNILGDDVTISFGVVNIDQMTGTANGEGILIETIDGKNLDVDFGATKIGLGTVTNIGVEISDVDAAATGFDVDFASLQTNRVKTGLLIDRVDTGTIDINGSTLIQNAGTDGIKIGDGSATVTFGGTVTTQNNSGFNGDHIDISGTAFTGTAVFKDQVRLTNSGSTGRGVVQGSGTVTFEKGLEISTLDAAGILGTGGTLNILNGGTETVTVGDATAVDLSNMTVDITLDAVNSNNTAKDTISLTNLDGTFALNGGTMSTAVTGTSFSAIDILQDDATATRALTVDIDGITVTQDASTTIGGDEHGLAAITKGDDSLTVSVSNSSFATEDSGVVLDGLNGLVTLTDFSNITLVGDNTASQPILFQNGVRFGGVVFDADPTTMALEAVSGGTFTAGTATERVSHGLFMPTIALDGVTVLPANTGTLDFTRFDVHAHNTALGTSGNQSGVTLSIADGVVDAATIAIGQGAGSLNGDITLSSLTLKNTTGFGNGLDVTGLSGSFQVTGATTITAPEVLRVNLIPGGNPLIRFFPTVAITITNSSADFTFGSVTVLKETTLSPAAAPGSVATNGAPTVGIDLTGNTGGFSVSGLTQIEDTLEDAIRITDVSGEVSFAGVQITNPGAPASVMNFDDFAPPDPNKAGIDISGTIGAPITFTDLDITLATAGTTGLDLSGAILNSDVTVSDFSVLTSGAPASTVGVDIAGTTGTGKVVLGQTTAPFDTGPSSFIGDASGMNGTATGIQLSSTTAVDFTFGDGEGTIDAASRITADNIIVSTDATLPTGPTINLLDIDGANNGFTGDVTNLIGSLTSTVFFVDPSPNSDPGAGPLGSYENPGSIQNAEQSAADIIIVMPDQATNIIDISASSQNGGSLIDLNPNQALGGFWTLDANGDLVSRASIDLMDLGATITAGAPANFQLTGLSPEDGIIDNPTATMGGTGTAAVLTSSAGSSSRFLDLRSGNIIDGISVDLEANPRSAIAHALSTRSLASLTIRNSEFKGFGDPVNNTTRVGILLDGEAQNVLFENLSLLPTTGSVTDQGIRTRDVVGSFIVRDSFFGKTGQEIRQAFNIDNAIGAVNQTSQISITGNTIQATGTQDKISFVFDDADGGTINISDNTINSVAGPASRGINVAGVGSNKTGVFSDITVSNNTLTGSYDQAGIEVTGQGGFTSGGFGAVRITDNDLSQAILTRDGIRAFGSTSSAATNETLLLELILTGNTVGSATNRAGEDALQIFNRSNNTGQTSITIRDNTLFAGTGQTGDEVIEVFLDGTGDYIFDVGDNQISATSGVSGSADAALFSLNQLDAGGSVVFKDFSGWTFGAGNTGGIQVFAGTNAPVTFDANPMTAAIEAVNFGALAIGSATERVSSVGLRLNNVLGEIEFDDLDIFTTGNQGALIISSNGADPNNLSVAVDNTQSVTLDAPGNRAATFQGLTLEAGFANTNASGIFLQNVTSVGGLNFAGTSTFDGTGGSQSVIFLGDINTDVHFDNLQIGMAVDNRTALRFENSVINGDITADQFALTSTAANTVGINLSNTTGTGSIVLGETANPGTDTPSMISGVEVGLRFDANTNIAFTFGDGEEGTDTASTISATTVFDGVIPSNGTYNFLDIGVGGFIGDTSLIPSGPEVFWVDQVGAGDGSSVANAGNIAGANAATANVIALVDTDLGANAGSAALIDGGMGLVLDPGQVLLSIAQGDATIDLSQFGIPAGTTPGNFSFATGVFPAGTSMLSAPAGIDSVRPTLTTNGTIGSTGVLIEGSGAILNTRINAPNFHGVAYAGVGSGDFVLQNVIVENALIPFRLNGSGGLNFTGTGNQAIGDNSSSNALFIQGAGAGFSGVSIGAAGLGFDLVNANAVSDVGVVINGLAGPGTLTIADLQTTTSAASIQRAVTIDNTTADIVVTSGLVRHLSNTTAVAIGNAGANAGGSNAIQFGANFNSTQFAGGRALDVFQRTGGMVTFSGSFLDDASSGGGINLQNNSGGTVTFSGPSMTVNTGANGGVLLTSNAGLTTNFNGNLDIDTTNGVGLNYNGGGTVNITGALNIDSTTGTTMSVINGGASTFTANSAANTLASTSGEILNISSAIVNATFATASATALNTHKGLDINNHSGTLTINGGTISNTGGGESIEITGGNSTISIATNIDSSGANNAGATTNLYAAEVANRSGGSVTLSGNFLDDGGNGGRILVQNNNNSTVTFSGTTVQVNSADRTAVDLSNNGTTAINFNAGTLDIDTTTGIGFRSSTGGVVTVTDPVNPDNSIMVSGNGQAVLLENTTIGAGGINFASIGQNGSATAITLNNTGMTGLFNVTGTGAPNSGGTIIGGTAIDLDGSFQAEFNRMNLSSVQTGIDAVVGTGGNGDVVFQDGMMTGIGGGSVPDLVSGVVSANGVLDVDILRSDLSVPLPNLLGVVDLRASDMSTLTFDISDNTRLAPNGTSAVFIQAENFASATGSVTGNTNIDLQGNAGIGVFFNIDDNAIGTVNISNNTVALGTDTGGGIHVSAGDASTDATTVNATINNNTINIGAAPGFGRGIQLIDHGNSTLCANVTNNSVADGPNAPDIGISIVDQGFGSAILLQGLGVPVNGFGGTIGAVDAWWTGNGNTSTADAGNTFLQGSAAPAPGACITVP